MKFYDIVSKTPSDQLTNQPTNDFKGNLHNLSILPQFTVVSCLRPATTTTTTTSISETTAK